IDVDYEQADDERTESDDEEEEKQDDEYKHTPDYYVPTYEEINDESKEFDKEEYEDLYGDVNISDAELKNVNQEGEGNQVKDDAQATHKTEGPIPSSSISFDYAAKYLNFDNIPLVYIEVVSILDINVQYEVLRTSPLLTIPVSNYKFGERLQRAKSSALLSTIKSEVPKAVKEYLGTIMDDSLQKVLKKHSADLAKEHFVKAEVVERIRQKYVLEKSFEDIRKIKMEHARKNQEPKATITSFDTSALKEIDQKTTLFQTMTNSKSFNRIPKQRSLYHALMESILKDEDDMDEGVADKLKKRKQDDADKDEGPSARSDRGLKRQKTSKDSKPSKKAKSIEAS
ncbi:hypothetical protein Tco_0950618, partial [Tanacetum coccineum]